MNNDISDLLDVILDSATVAGDLIDPSFDIEDLDIGVDLDLEMTDEIIPESSLAFQSNYNRYEHIDSLYDGEISDAHDKYIEDLERIEKGETYSWEKASETLKKDKQDIEFWENAKERAISNAEMDEIKMQRILGPLEIEERYRDELEERYRERKAKR
ncbi:MAG: hypothetical protein UH641_04230 [Bacteroidales bacterium]|nr:hypothetical protein [Bacteroidales bacterium]